MNTHILIFSYPHDIPYLEYCLRSYDKFCTGFTGVTVAVAKGDETAFDELAKKHVFNIITYDAPADKKFGHIVHQGEKCKADYFVPPGTDLVLFTDSDCIWTAPVTPETYMKDGLPVLLIERYDSIKGCPWQKPTSEILGRPVDYETMRRHPAVHWVEMFQDLRREVERIHSKEFMEFILTRKPDFPWGLSEFNLMGSYILNSDWAAKYQFIDLTGGKPHPESSKYLMQFWSRSPIDKPQDTPWGHKVVPLEYCKKIGL